MGLKDLNLKFYYNNDEDDLIDDFYNPVMVKLLIIKGVQDFFQVHHFGK